MSESEASYELEDLFAEEEVYMVDDEVGGRDTGLAAIESGDFVLGEDPYQDDPIADEEWIRRYNEEMEEEKLRNEELTRRLNFSTDLSL